jgi:hypothetical protein
MASASSRSDAVVGRLVGSSQASEHKQCREVYVPDSFLSVPSVREVAELSAATLKSGPTLLELFSQAQKNPVNGQVLCCPAVFEMRLRAITWFSSQFHALGYRDEWLADAVNYMDRVAALWSTKSIAGKSSRASSDELEDDTIEKAAQVMACDEFWLAAVKVALKMSEAENELDSTAHELVLPLVSFGQRGFVYDRSVRHKIDVAELKLLDELDFSLVPPNALVLVDRLAHEVVQAACVNSKWQLSALTNAELEQVCWGGLEEGYLPLLRGPPSNCPCSVCKEVENVRMKSAMPRRGLTLFQALARFLLEVISVHDPGKSHGRGNHLCVLAIAVVQLALHSFDRTGPPSSCVVALANIKAQTLTSAEKRLQSNLLDCIHTLWSNLPQTCPVQAKWCCRGFALPSPAACQLRPGRPRWAAGVLRPRQPRRPRWAAGVLEISPKRMRIRQKQADPCRV